MTTEPNYTDVLNEKCNEFRQRAANLMTDTKDKKHCAAGQAYLDCAMEFEYLLSERQAAMQEQGGEVQNFSREDVLRVIEYANAPGLKYVTAEMSAMVQELLPRYATQVVPELINGTLDSLSAISIRPKDTQA